MAPRGFCPPRRKRWVLIPEVLELDPSAGDEDETGEGDLGPGRRGQRFPGPPRSARKVPLGDPPLRAARPRGGAAPGAQVPRNRRSRGGEAARHRQPAARGQDRADVPPGRREPPRPDPGGECRADPGPRPFRPGAGSPLLDLRVLVGQGLHPQVPPGQRAHGESGDDERAAQAPLQPEPREEAARGGGLLGGPEAARREIRGFRAGRRGHRAVAGRAGTSRSMRRWARRGAPPGAT